MDLSKIEDVLKLHGDFAALTLQRGAAESASERPDARDVGSALAAAQQRLSLSLKSKEEAVQRHDAQIARLEARIRELEGLATAARPKEPVEAERGKKPGRKGR